MVPATTTELEWLVRDIRTNSVEQAESEVIPSRLYVLEGDFGVFLEEIEELRLSVLDLSSGPSIEKRQVQFIDSGTFLVLRTQGGGDYISELADLLMGDVAVTLRANQDMWKSRLRDLVRDIGLEEVANRIRRTSKLNVQPYHLRYWMWSGNIGPDNPQDFEAITRVVGLEDRYATLLDGINVIRNSHRSAGKRIAAQLRALVSQMSLSELRDLINTGIKDFTLPQHDGGSVSVIRVVERTNIVEPLPSRRARQLFDMEGGRWLE
jgi:hypothetical protein